MQTQFQTEPPTDHAQAMVDEAPCNAVAAVSRPQPDGLVQLARLLARNAAAIEQSRVIVQIGLTGPASGGCGRSAAAPEI